MQICTICSGTGLITTNERPSSNEKKYPHVAIVGAGIGGIAFALACLHRQIPFTLFELTLFQTPLFFLHHALYHIYNRQ